MRWRETKGTEERRSKRGAVESEKKSKKIRKGKEHH
jgi:hypothetical protein